jgi:AcrR family transcriptional regulator
VSRRLSGDDRREHLLSVGVDLLGRHGIEHVSIERIARAAGVSKGLLYHYFPTKDEFLLAVLARSQGEVDEHFQRDPELTPLQQFDSNLEGFLRFVDERAAGYLDVATARGREPRVQQLVASRRRQRIDELVALAAALEDRPREQVRTPVLEAALDGWLGYSEGVILRWLRERRVTREQVHALLREALLQAFAASVEVATDTNGAVPP